MTPKVLARRDPDAWLVDTLARLEGWGLILDSDPTLPSWPSLVVERPVRGSWWADPDVHLIHEVGSRLVEHPDVLHVVLVSGKLTCLHRRLWPAYLAVALAEDAWKLEGLGPAARALLGRLQEAHELSADEPNLPSSNVRANGRAMRELEARLLAAGGSVHTPRGSHAKSLTTWRTWMSQRKLPRPTMSASEGRRQLDACLDRLNRDFHAHGTMPWRRTIPSP